MIFISAIIPVYNVAPYLRECLDSVVAQPLSNWEAICVDDGSTDGSGAILDEYAAKDSRIKVIHKVNEGVSIARNVALERMTGEYFTFLDGDDSIEPDGLMKMKEALSSGEFDGVFIKRNQPEERIAPAPVKRRVDFLTGELASFGYPFCRVYRRDVFKGVRFIPGMRYREDLCYWSDALSCDGRWGISAFDYYNYREREGSATATVRPADYKDLVSCHIHVIGNMRKNMAATEADVRNYIKHTTDDFSGVIYGLFWNWRYLKEDQRRAMVDLIARTKEIVGYDPYNGWVSCYLAMKDSAIALKVLCEIHRIYAGIRRRLI